jgi:thiol-disulfide isomerase/thioredoxin
MDQQRRFTLKQYRLISIIFIFTLAFSACAPTQPNNLPEAQASNTIEPESMIPSASASASFSDWVNIKMVDVRTGNIFAISDFAGKVVLIETIAEWCPNCLFQQGETRKMSKQLGNPDDLILISLDVDLHENEASLKKYSEDFGFEWRFAVAPLEVQRALGNLYNAEYLNPPLEPMLLIDRQGYVHQLEYGQKEADKLQKIVEPFLAK